MFAGNRPVAIKLARIYADSSVAIQKELGDLYLLQDTYISMSDAWEQTGDYKGALECYKNYIKARDSAFNLEKDKKLTQLAMKYEFDKKQATDSIQYAVENNLNQLRLQKQKTFTWMEPERIDFSLHETVKQVLETLRHKADEKGLY